MNSVINKAYPELAAVLEEEDKDLFSAEALKDDEVLRSQFYFINGFPEEAYQDSDPAIRATKMRIDMYKNRDMVQDSDLDIASEAIIASTIDSFDIETLKKHDDLLNIKAMKSKNIEEFDSILSVLKEKNKNNSFYDSELVTMKVLKAHSFNCLDSFEKQIKLKKDSPDLIAWKRTRQELQRVMSLPTQTFSDLISQLPTMKCVDAVSVFNETLEQHKEAIEMTKILVKSICYREASDKDRILSGLDNYMEQKDLVKMLPEYKDKWVNGRLVFEIGDDARDYFKRYKGVLNTKYFVITVNPVDMLFCSTDQEYHSCFSLNSPHASSLGLPNFITQPNVAMCFLSSGSLSKPYRWLDTFKWKHIKIKARGFIYSSKDLKMASVGRCYAPDQIQEVATNYSINTDFRFEANLMLWGLLKPSSDTLLRSGLHKKDIKKYLNNTLAFDTPFNIKFNLRGYDYAPIKKDLEYSEVYLDNCKYFKFGCSDVPYYTYRSGAGSCHSFNGSGSLRSVVDFVKAQALIQEKEEVLK